MPGGGSSSYISELHSDLNSGLKQSLTAVVVENAAGNFLELFVADLRVGGHDFFAHSRW